MPTQENRQPEMANCAPSSFTLLARRICHAVDQRTDDCDMEMHTRVLAELKAWSYDTKVLNSLAGQAEQLRSGISDTSEKWRFANWYALHGIPLGIGRDNARVIYEAALNASNADVLENWRADYNAMMEQRDAWKAAFDEVEGQRNSLVTEIETLRELIVNEIDDAHKLVGDELVIYCYCGHRKEKHDSSIGRCRAPKCDCMELNAPAPLLLNKRT